MKMSSLTLQSEMLNPLRESVLLIDSFPPGSMVEDHFSGKVGVVVNIPGGREVDVLWLDGTHSRVAIVWLNVVQVLEKICKS